MGYNLELSPEVHRMSRCGQAGPAGPPRVFPRSLARSAWIVAAVFLFVVGWMPGIALAQPELSSRIEGELDRTDRIIERAKDQAGVTTSTNDRVTQLLRQAEKLQGDARETYKPNDRRTWAAAMKLTMSARDLARRALESGEIDVKAHESIRDLLESTKDLIDRAATIVGEHGDAEAKKLLDSGIWQLDRAQDAYHDENYRKAIRLAASASDLVQRAIQRARADTSGGPPSLDRALERTDTLIDELRAGIAENSNSNARDLLDQAVELQSRARKVMLSQRPGMALRLTAQAGQSALDGLLLLARNPSRGDVERALAVVDQLTSDLAPDVASSGSPEAQVLLDSSRQRQTEAADHLAKGEFAAAIESARISEALLRRAAEAAGIR